MKYYYGDARIQFDPLLPVPSDLFPLNLINHPDTINATHSTSNNCSTILIHLKKVEESRTLLLLPMITTTTILFKGKIQKKIGLLPVKRKVHQKEESFEVLRLE